MCHAVLPSHGYAELQGLHTLISLLTSQLITNLLKFLLGVTLQYLCHGLTHSVSRPFSREWLFNLLFLSFEHKVSRSPVWLQIHCVS